jgi:hypothetical protein
MMVRTILEDQGCSQRPEVHARTMYVDAEKMLTSLGNKERPSKTFFFHDTSLTYTMRTKSLRR